MQRRTTTNGRGATVGWPPPAGADPRADHHLWRNGRTFWVAFTLETHEGRRHRVRRSLGTRDVREARERRDALLARYARQRGWLLPLRYAPARRDASSRAIEPDPMATPEHMAVFGRTDARRGWWDRAERAYTPRPPWSSSSSTPRSRTTPAAPHGSQQPPVCACTSSSRSGSRSRTAI